MLARPYNDEQLRRKIDNLTKYCSTHAKSDAVNLFTRPRWSFHRSHAHLGVKTLGKLCKRTERGKLLSVDISKLVLCGVSLSRHFLVISKPVEYTKAIQVFETLVLAISPEKLKETTDTLLAYIESENLWNKRDLVVDLLTTTLKNDNHDYLLNKLLDLTSSNDAKLTFNAIASLVVKCRWKGDGKFVTRLCEKFHESVMSRSTQETYLKICFRELCPHIEQKDIPQLIIASLHVYDEGLNNFSHSIEYLAECYETVDLRDLTSLFSIVFDLMKSHDRIQFLFGCRLFQNIIDRVDNKRHPNKMNSFYTKYTHLDVKLRDYSTEDVDNLEKFVESLFEVLLWGIVRHGDHLWSSVNIFFCASLTVVNVACGEMIVGAVSFALGVQRYALNAWGNSAHRLHALVGGLLCLVARSQVPHLLNYVTKPLLMRAKFAPHLNPPVHHYYTYNYNSITWYDPELFFEEYFICQAVWKHFHEINKMNRESSVAGAVEETNEAPTV